MPTLVLTDALVTINSIDLSDHVRSITFTYEGEEVDDTNMADTTRIMQGGLLNYGVDIEFSQDYAASEVDATLFPLVGTTTSVAIQPVSGAKSATNPSFEATMLLSSYSPIQGAVGDLAIAPVHFGPASTLVRNVGS